MLIPLIAVVVIAVIYREELGLRSLLIYGGVSVAAILAVFTLSLSPGIFIAVECGVAIAMLIHVRANPNIPLR